ncbi:hypothetical protein DSECCO2_359860 [anaerobic digester metagenome]|jgi:hypothetical protein|nr:GxxExxY protein [Candidatus Methanomethylophilaceae archaeon]
MSFTEYNLYPNVLRNLGNQFKYKDGWEIIPQYRGRTGYRPDFVIQRKNRGKIERVVVEVKAVKRISQRDITQVHRYVRALSGRNVKIVGRILAVPAGTRTDLVPSNFRKMILRSYHIV